MSSPAVDFIEVHSAHGYFLHEFLSPLSNTRTDDFGGQPLENRLRLPLNIVKRVREAWGTEKPLFVRVSASDWAEGPEKGEDGKWKQWGVEQTKVFVDEVQKLGVDLVDVSSGGLWAKQQITLGPGYQVRVLGLLSEFSVKPYQFERTRFLSRRRSSLPQQYPSPPSASSPMQSRQRQYCSRNRPTSSSSRASCCVTRTGH